MELVEADVDVDCEVLEVEIDEEVDVVVAPDV